MGKMASLVLNLLLEIGGMIRAQYFQSFLDVYG